MPRLDIEPHEYSRTDPRTGRMVRDFSPKWARNWFLVCLPFLIWGYWTSGTGNPQLSFAFGAFWAFCAGVMFANWLKNVY